MSARPLSGAQLTADHVGLQATNMAMDQHGRFVLLAGRRCLALVDLCAKEADEGKVTLDVALRVNRSDTASRGVVGDVARVAFASSASHQGWSSATVDAAVAIGDDVEFLSVTPAEISEMGKINHSR
jgi:hypothetical protein